MPDSPVRSWSQPGPGRGLEGGSTGGSVGGGWCSPNQPRAPAPSTAPRIATARATPRTIQDALPVCSAVIRMSHLGSWETRWGELPGLPAGGLPGAGLFLHLPLPLALQLQAPLVVLPGLL